MKKKIEKATVYDGFRIEDTEKHMSVPEAVILLKTKKKKQYLTAVRIDDDNALLTKREVICPHCGQRYSVSNHDSENIVSKADIDEWGSRQMCLFERPKTKLLLGHVPYVIGQFICPYCMRESHMAEKKYNAHIISQKKKLIVLLYEVNSKTNSDLKYTKLTFNLKNGHTFIEEFDVKNNRTCIKDITPYNERTFENRQAIQLISQPVIFRKIIRAYEKISGYPFPFPVKIATLKDLILENEFTGFPEEFYDSIPFNTKTAKLDSTFKKKKLHTITTAKNELNQSAIPNVKSIRRAIFQNPEYLFFISEMEQTWLLFNNDINYFTKFLIQGGAQDVLKDIHTYPNIISFFDDLKSVCGIRRLLYIFALYDYTDYALEYLASREYIKREQQRKWKQGCLNFHKKISENAYSESTNCIPDEEDDYRKAPANMFVNGFEFLKLSRSLDYIEAGNKLSNCLGHFRAAKYGVVFIIKKGDQFKGAIEVDDGFVMQAFAAHNEAISTKKDVYRAYKKWLKINQLEEADYDFENNDDDDD